MYLQKYRSHFFKFVLASLLFVSLYGCNRDDEDALVGTYTLVRLEADLGGEIVNLPSTGTLTISSDGRYTIRFTGGSSGSGTGTGTWNAGVLVPDDGNAIFYVFDGSTLEFDISVEDVTFTYVWQKV